MKLITKVLCTVIVLSVCFSLCASADTQKLDSGMRDPDLYEAVVSDFDGFFTLLLPSEWYDVELDQEDIDNGLIAYYVDSDEKTSAALTISYYTPEEIAEIAEGTGYDAILSALSAEGVDYTEVMINDINTACYPDASEEGIESTVVNFASDDGGMYQLILDVATGSNMDAYRNNILWSLSKMN